jgi:hypothetical protein
LCRWPDKEGLIRPGPKSGNTTTIYHTQLLGIWTWKPKPEPLQSFTTSLVQKPGERGNTLAMT